MSIVLGSDTNKLDQEIQLIGIYKTLYSQGNFSMDSSGTPDILLLIS